ncbi:MAG: hypothetical protein AAGI17_03550 [Planctomycetota bacterium]
MVTPGQTPEGSGLTPETPGLTPEGRARSEAMLGELQGAVRARRRRRKAVRAGGVVTVLAVCGIAVIVGVRPSGSPGPAAVPDARVASADPVDDAVGTPPETVSSTIASGTRSVGFGLVRTSAVADVVPLEEIDDDELLRLLAEAGYEGGLIKRDGKVELTAPLPGQDDEDDAAEEPAAG